METLLSNPLFLMLAWLLFMSMYLTFVPNEKIQVLGKFFKQVLTLIPFTAIIKMWKWRNVEKEGQDDN